MLCGSLTFFIGFLLLPWVLALIIVFYVAGIVSAISIAWRSIHALLRLDASSLLHKGDFCQFHVCGGYNVHWKLL
ncbi:unnamed protein product [Brassica oleracea]